jgi:hypothetical protein
MSNNNTEAKLPKISQVEFSAELSVGLTRRFSMANGGNIATGEGAIAPRFRRGVGVGKGSWRVAVAEICEGVGLGRAVAT